MNLYVLILLAFFAVEIGSVLAMHGLNKTGKYNALTAVPVLVLWGWLAYKAGSIGG